MPGSPTSQPSNPARRVRSRRKDSSRWLSIYFPDPRLLVVLREIAKADRKPVSTLCREILADRLWRDGHRGFTL